MRRWLGLTTLLAGAATALWPTRADAAGDPNLKWTTLESAHFRVTYHSGEAEAAARIVDVGENALDVVGSELGHVPSERTEIILTDFTDSANGSATAVPFNTIRLFLTAPDDLSPLSDVDDWLLDLTTHEYTHILHLDQIRGVPAIVNRIVGKRWAPNQIQPRWILEGLAVLEETKHTSAGSATFGDLGPVPARRLPRRQARHARPDEQLRAPLPAGQHLVPVRLVFLEVDLRARTAKERSAR